MTDNKKTNGSTVLKNYLALKNEKKTVVLILNTACYSVHNQSLYFLYWKNSLTANTKTILYSLTTTIFFFTELKQAYCYIESSPNQARLSHLPYLTKY